MFEAEQAARAVDRHADRIEAEGMPMWAVLSTGAEPFAGEQAQAPAFARADRVERSCGAGA